MTTADVTDRDGALARFAQSRQILWTVINVLADGDNTGETFAAGVQAVLGAEVEIAKRAELHRFVVMPKRWIVERSFAWLDKCQRLWKNHERKLETSFQFVAPALLLEDIEHRSEAPPTL